MVSKAIFYPDGYDAGGNFMLWILSWNSTDKKRFIWSIYLILLFYVQINNKIMNIKELYRMSK